MSESKTPDARTKVLNMREQQAKEAKARKIIKIGVALILAVCIVVAGVLVYKSGALAIPEKSADVAPNNITPVGSFVVNGEGSVVAPEGRKDIGDKIRVQLLFDPMCPGCGLVDRALSKKLIELAENGEIALQYTPLAFLDKASSDGYSTRASNAISTVAQDSPEHFFAFVTAVFENQPEEGEAYVPVTDEDLAKLAESVGVPSTVADTFKDAKFRDWVASNTLFNIGRKDLFGEEKFSTPAVFIGGSETDEGVVKDALRVDWTQDRTLEEAFDQTLEEAKTK